MSELAQQLTLLPELLSAHLTLSLTALALGTAISLPLAIWAARRPRLKQFVLGVASVIQTLPSLALLAMMVPLLAWLSVVTERLAGIPLQNIGFLPALIALTLYSFLPLLRNGVTGLNGVDPALIEAARGVGMTPLEQLLRVELPQAMPTLVAGLRTATTWVVSMTVLSTPIGAPSLGNYIFTGLQTRNTPAIVVGCLASAATALLLDGIIFVLEQGVRLRRRRAVVTSLFWLALLYGLVSFRLFAPKNDADARAVLHVGAKSFTEQYILAEILAQSLHAAGLGEITITQSLGSNVALEALHAGAIDLYVEYTGTLWTTLMKRALPLPRAEEARREMAAFLHAEANAILGPELGFSNAYTLAVRARVAEEHNLKSLCDLAPVASHLRAAGDYEFFSRPEWAAIEKTYGLVFGETRTMDPTLMYQAAAEEAVDVVSAYTTEGRLNTLQLVALTDPQGAVPSYEAVILVGRRMQKLPRALKALRRLDHILTVETMRQLNRIVDAGEESPHEAARDFLQEKGLLKNSGVQQIGAF